MKYLVVFLPISLFLLIFTGCKSDPVNNPVDSSNINLVTVYNTNESTNGVYVLPINFRDYALIADGNNGMQILDITLISQPDSVSSFQTNGSANDITAASINGDLYAFITDYTNGLYVVDIDSPNNPFLIGNIQPVGGFVNTTFIDANNKLAYIAFGTTVNVYDISALPNQPSFVSSINLGAGSNANGVYVSGGYAYIASGFVGLKIVNVTDPANPVDVSVVNTAGIASDVVVNGGYAYVGDSYNGMLILDVTNPSSPIVVSKFNAKGQILGVYAVNDNVFCADNTYGIENVNVSNHSSPSEAGYIQTNSSATNIFYFGGYIFLAAAEGGLGIYQPSNPADNKFIYR